VLYVSAEDPIGEIHYRLEQIKRQSKLQTLSGLKIMDLAGTDATLARFKQSGQIDPTPLLQQIEQVARDHMAGLVILDAVADFFGGNENDRGEVRSFIGMLRGLAMRCDAAILIVAHPSVEGIRSGRGYSGSTHWNNAVRSRLTFTTHEACKEEDPDRRVLELAKSNRARRGLKIELRWWEGSFVVAAPGVANAANDQYAEAVFLQLLDAFAAEGNNVSGKPRSPTYAPREFSKRPKGKDVGEKKFEAAMHRLFEKRVIKQVVDGAGTTRERGRIVRVPPVG